MSQVLCAVTLPTGHQTWKAFRNKARTALAAVPLEDDARQPQSTKFRSVSWRWRTRRRVFPGQPSDRLGSGPRTDSAAQKIAWRQVSVASICKAPLPSTSPWLLLASCSICSSTMFGTTSAWCSSASTSSLSVHQVRMGACAFSEHPRFQCWFLMFAE